MKTLLLLPILLITGCNNFYAEHEMNHRKRMDDLSYLERVLAIQRNEEWEDDMKQTRVLLDSLIESERINLVNSPIK